MKVLFLTSPDFHTKICLKIKKALENMHPKIEAKFIDCPLWRKDDTGYFENMFDKKVTNFVKGELDDYRPNVIVATDDGPTLFATFTKVARLKNIPVIVIQDGLKSGKEDFTFKVEIVFDVLRWNKFFLWHILSRISQIKIIARLTLFLGWRTRIFEWGLGGADLYAVMGFHTRRLLIFRGVSSNKIAVTGFPLFDDLKFLSEAQKDRVRRTLNLKKYDDVVLFLSQPLLSYRMWAKGERNRFLTSLLQSTKQLGVALVIKLHPREESDKYDEIMQMNRHLIVVKDYDLHELTQVSSVVVSINSTAALWALVYEKPLIIYQDRSMPERNWYKGVAIEVEDLDNLPKILENLIKDRQMKLKLLKDTKKKIGDYMYKLDGNASNRVANLILSLTKKED